MRKLFVAALSLYIPCLAFMVVTVAQQSRPGKQANTANQQANRLRDMFIKTEAAGGLPGTKVTIELLRNGQTSMVATDHEFQAGDRIRFHFETNFNGYIAVWNEGTTGKRTLLFPYAGVTNEVTPSADYTLPPGKSYIEFDNNPGTEKVVFVMSKNPIKEIAQYTQMPQPAQTGTTLKPENEQLKQETLTALNARSLAKGKGGRKRDMNIWHGDKDTIVVTNSENLQEPLSFTLELKHK